LTVPSIMNVRPPSALPSSHVTCAPTNKHRPTMGGSFSERQINGD
jgi:hypothetical protein